MLKCEACGCTTASAKGWFAYIAEDPEGDEPAVCTYCPPCAERDLDARPREPLYV